jgi:uncharacterized protein (TIGR02246 family)
MKRIVFQSSFLMLLLLVGASVSAQTTEVLRAKIEKINKDMQQAMTTGNTSVSLAYYANDAVSLPNYGKIAQGLEAIKKSNEQMMASGMKILSFETKILQLNTCGNMITETGTYKMSFTATGMTGPMEDLGKYLTIWEQQSDGSLRIKLEMWNTDNYPMGEM